jgi:hypothetical protein
MGIIALLIQLFAPLLVIVFFAVSPMQFFMGHRAVVGSETTQNSFVCPMGIEWQGGSEKYLKILGQDHSQHINHHDMHHDNNNKHTQETPEPCPIEKMLIISKQFLDNFFSFNSLLLFIVFILLLIIPQKRFLHLLKRSLLYITPPRHAPPAFVY